MPTWRMTNFAESKASASNKSSKGGQSKGWPTKTSSRKASNALMRSTHNSKGDENAVKSRKRRRHSTRKRAASQFRRSLPVLAKTWIHQLRRADWTNRGHARGVGGKKEMDQRSSLPACAQLLHAATRTGSSTTGYLCRLASAQNMGRHCCGRSFCHPVDVRSLGAQLYLCDSGKSALGRSHLLRSKASRTRDCGRRSYPHRESGPEERSDVDAGGGGLYSHLFFPCSISSDHHQCRSHRIFRRQVEAR